MICPNCNSALDGNSKFCTNCGAPIPVSKPEPYVEPVVYTPTHSSTSPESSAVRKVTYGEAIGSFFRNYAVFSGRATRSEYWYVFLFHIVMNIVFSIGASLAPDMNNILSTLYSLGTIIPGWALFTRRMHDAGKSGWSWLWILLPLVGPIVILCLACRASDEDNKYGPRPV